MHTGATLKRRADMDSKAGLRKQSGSNNVRGARKTATVRPNHSAKAPEISSVDALKIIRSGLDENKPATDFDWEKIERLLGNSANVAPSEAITSDQYSGKFGVSESSSRRSLSKLVGRGIMETGIFPSRGRDRTPTRYWWIKKESS